MSLWRFAMLAKGPVGILIPLLGVIAYLTISRKWRSFGKIGFPVLGPLLVLVISAPMVSGHVCHPWRGLPGCRSGEYHGAICQSHGGAWWYAPFLYTHFVSWIFPLERVPSCLNVSDPQGLETVSNRRTRSHARGKASPIRGPLGPEFVPLLYSFGHPASTLYFPTVSSSGDPCGFVLVTMPHRVIITRPQKFHTDSGRHWLYVGISVGRGSCRLWRVGGKNYKGISRSQPAQFRPHSCCDGRCRDRRNHDGATSYGLRTTPGSGVLGGGCHDWGIGPAGHSFWAPPIQSLFYCSSAGTSQNRRL